MIEKKWKYEKLVKSLKSKYSFISRQKIIENFIGFSHLFYPLIQLMILAFYL